MSWGTYTANEDVKLSFELLDKSLVLLEAQISSFKVDP